MRKLTFIDLFCGCGGFTLGMERAGFDCLAAVDSNPQAIAVFRRNFSRRIPHILDRDLTGLPPSELANIIESDGADVIVGGPPCQGFSTVRQADGANHGKRMVPDARRHLYREFLRYVEFFRPKVFVMENVLGIRSASGGEYFVRVQKEARALGYRVHTQIENCVVLGVPQMRRRQLFIGTRLGLPDYFRPDLEPAPRACYHPPLWEAIGDLPPVTAREGEESCDYDMERREAHVERFGRRYLYIVLEIKRAANLTAPREAARIQSFPDWSEFPIDRTHQFRVIGNAGPPLVSEAVGNPALN